MLKLDALGSRRAAREIVNPTDPEVMRRDQEAWVNKHWPIAHNSWVTCYRDHGELYFTREDC